MVILYSNPAAEALTGYTYFEANGKYCHEIFCEPSSYCDDGCPLKRAVTTFEPVLHREAETRRKDGTVRQTQLSVAPFFEGGVCTGAVLVLKDITVLKEAEERIRRQNFFLSTVIDSLSYPFRVIDTDTFEVKLANRTACPQGLRKGITCFELTHHRTSVCETESGHPCPIGLIKESGRATMVEHIHFDADGAEHNVEVHCFPIFGENGAIPQVIEYSIDVSQRKRMEEERERLITELKDALARVRVLSGLLPICSSCKKIRDDTGYWSQIEEYIRQHSGAEFSHGICPECAEDLYPEVYKKIKERNG